jgi:hypothetical protein
MMVDARPRAPTNDQRPPADSPDNPSILFQRKEAGMIRSETLKGLAIGLGIAVAAPVVIVSLFGASRPLARAAIKSGIILFEKGREVATEFAEVVEDLVAEAKAEMAHGHPHAAETEIGSAALEPEHGISSAEQPAADTKGKQA